ncbi:hypothetical protein [Streptomyces sp. NPDC089799]|uniref:hypothetical protein n=1 Tax=Streptomyces sp. NPDC089799 TaxID=3155066 RepID=UPI0034269A56
MTGSPPGPSPGPAAGAVLRRLRAVEWDCSWERAYARVLSRRVLMRDHLRRAGLWARALGAVDAWPFFDVSAHADPRFALAPETEAELTAFLGGLPVDTEVRRTCAGAVRTAGLLERAPGAARGLPDPYEPLLLFFERGGAFHHDSGGFLDLTGVLMRPRSLAGHLGTPVLRSLDPVLLDALDAPGRVTYFLAEDRSGPVLRTRATRGAEHHEAFRPEDRRWVPAPAPAGDAGRVRLDEVEAADRVAEALGLQDPPR